VNFDAPAPTGIVALLGPTNTGKTHRAVERMLEHRTGMIGLPLRLLAREVYDRVTMRIGERAVALVTGEEKRVPTHPSYWICTTESMPVGIDVDFVAVDEIQLAAHPQRGHTFTERMLHARGTRETWFLGADTMRPLVESLLPTARIERHQRFSRLSWVGTLALGGLPARTAVVAFSVADVYEIAERLRQRHGGTAVVLGALSPRTRNAQVAMYQAGEVEYMVATDAIGMGLNMDVDRVVFAELHKFDGHDVRPLEAAELGQIAGRAGRYTTDGGFGTLRPLPGLPPRTIAAIENHDFPPVRKLVWRNADLDYGSIDALLASLRRRPPNPALRVVERAEDYDALVQLARREDVRERARTPEDVALLWEVCRIPDYRKLLVESHVQLLADLYEQLTGPTRRIDADWMARRIKFIDGVDGDIDTLTNRISFVRTWTYIAYHEDWVPDAAHWQGITRGIEDRQSDALHERLTERFVGREREGWVRTARPRKPIHAPEAGAEARPTTGPFARLLELELELPDAPGTESARGDAWVQTIVDAVHADFGLDAAGRIAHEGRVIAELARGPDLLHPDVRLVELGELGAGARARLLRRMVAWSRDAVGELLAPVRANDEQLGPAARGLLYLLERGLGTVDEPDARTQIAGLSQLDRARLHELGVELGPAAAFVPAIATGATVRLRAALWIASHDPRPRPELPVPGVVSVPVRADIDRSFHPAVGYLVRGPRAVRVDVLARVHERLERLGEGGEAPADLGAQLGTRRAELAAVLRAMGWRTNADGTLERVHSRAAAAAKRRS
jgi:ATP-dependent RNA helicase SUPV3L1/SUV3